MYSPPSGARPSSRISEKPRRAASPRVLTYFIGTAPPSAQLFLADADDRREHGRQRLHLLDRGGHPAFDRVVREDDDVGARGRGARLMGTGPLQQRVDRDAVLGED